jgi:hypothetical protein
MFPFGALTLLCSLGEAFHDHVTLRRNFVEYGFMERLPDGSKYWVKTGE